MNIQDIVVEIDAEMSIGITPTLLRESGIRAARSWKMGGSSKPTQASPELFPPLKSRSY